MAEEALTIESAALGLLQQESQDQPDAEDVTDASEEDAEEPEDIEDEAEEVEAESDDDPEADADDDEDEPEEPEETDDDDDPVISLDDGTEIAFSELQKGYMRERDYTRKTQTLAEERRTFDAERQQVTEALRQQYAQLQDNLATFAIEQEQEPDWDNLSGDDYVKAQRSWDKKQKRKQQAAQAYQALKQQQHAETVQRETAALYEAFPDWRDPKVFQSEANAMVEMGQSFGFTPDEMAALTDHRMFKVLHRLKTLEGQATKQKQNNAKVAKRVAKAAKKPAPSSKPAKNQEAQHKARRQKLDRLKKTGSLRDAAAAIIMES